MDKKFNVNTKNKMFGKIPKYPSETIVLSFSHKSDAVAFHKIVEHDFINTLWVFY